MTHVQTAPATPAASKVRRSLSQAGDQLGRIVGRVPATVRTKLLVGFLAIAALLVLLALLGLRVLGQANTRAEHLGALQQRVAGYTQLEADAVNVRHILGICSGGSGAATWANGGKPTAGPGPNCLRRIGQPLDASLGLLGQATDLGFRPTPVELSVYRSIRRDYASLNRAVTGFKADRYVSPALHERAENLATDLEIGAERLAHSTAEKTAALVGANRQSYSSSRNLFIGVAGGAVALALLLGFLLAWSLINPIQGIGARLAEIARGDFSGRLGVPNRDELGELAANVNQMNDELKRLYREV